MSKRINIERQNELEPQRIEYAIEQLEKLGIKILNEPGKKIIFEFNGSIVTFFPYSGWHSGKTIKDGRGIQNLLNQLKEKK